MEIYRRQGELFLNKFFNVRQITLVAVWPQQLALSAWIRHDGRIIFWLDSITVLYISLSVSLILLMLGHEATVNLHFTPSK